MKRFTVYRSDIAVTASPLHWFMEQGV